MSNRLGEVLIAKGILDERQLKMALDAQLIYGGHLGTCLVELGFVDVNRLAQVLGERFQIKHADRDRFDAVPAQVLDALPLKLVERHKAVPFALEGRILHVAMIDPSNLLALDEISFASGYRIEAWIAPEIIVLRAMERFYSVGRKLRHIPVSGSPVRTAPAPPRPATPASQAAPDAAAVRRELLALADRQAAKRPAAPCPAPEPPPRMKFVAQTIPRTAELAQKQRGGGAVEWIKMLRDGREVWCELDSAPLEHAHFDGREGIYVLWHHGHNPVLRVGHGPIRDRLVEARTDPNLGAIREQSPIYVTWASVPPASLPGIERFLLESLSPQFMIAVPTVAPVPVNLPR